MNTLIKLLFVLLFIPAITFAGAYRDTYEVEIQREIMQIQNEVNMGTATDFEVKKKAYLENRLKKMTAVGVARVAFSTKVKKREPVDSITSISYKERSVYLFTEIDNMRGKYITHVWYFKDKEIFKKRFKIRGSSWRVWTRKTITKSMIGVWKTIVKDDSGNILTTNQLRVTE